MKGQLYFAIVLLTITSLIGVACAPLTLAPMGKAAASDTAYVEPALLSQAGGALSVIVTASDSQAAARAVERFGGQVTSDLWLIDAVAAMIPAGQVEALARYPGIQSIVNNKGVKTADGPNWDGWVTEIRVEKGTHALEDVQLTSAAYLPDGGLVSIAQNGKVLIVNADGSERARVSLSGGPYKTAAVISAEDGTIYVAGEAKRVYALNPDGSRTLGVQWSSGEIQGRRDVGARSHCLCRRREAQRLRPGSGHWADAVGVFR